MSSPLSAAIASLSSPEPSTRQEAAEEIYALGRAAAGSAISDWWKDSELATLLLDPKPDITVGVAVQRDTFSRIRIAHGTPKLAEIPADQDAEEFELHFANGVSLDILTTREPGGTGTIAKYLAKFGEGVQQVEFRCLDVDQATKILKEKFGVGAVYAETRPGADATRVNFFLVGLPQGGKILIELYERKGG